MDWQNDRCKARYIDIYIDCHKERDKRTKASN